SLARAGMLDLILRRYFRQGSLTLRLPNGRTETIGGGVPHVAIRITDRAALWAIALDPDLKLGEMYMAGRLVIDEGDIVQLMALLMGNLARAGTAGSHRLLRQLRKALRAFAQWNPVTRARAHAAHHYDLSRRLYDLFLDPSRQYSCAYFAHDDDGLEAAQAA